MMISRIWYEAMQAIRQATDYHMKKARFHADLYRSIELMDDLEEIERLVAHLPDNEYTQSIFAITDKWLTEEKPKRKNDEAMDFSGKHIR